MQTTEETTQRKLLKKFHALLGKCGLNDDDKEVILSQYGVLSSRDLSARELLDVCGKLEKDAFPEIAEQDKYRKRLIAAIGAWLRAMGKENNIDVIKGIACRASGVKRFNQIPAEKLRSLYSAFTKKKKDLETVEKLTADELDLSAMAN